MWAQIFLRQKITNKATRIIFDIAKIDKCSKLPLRAITLTFYTYCFILIGKIVDGIPLYRGHTAAVLDTDFANFNDNVIASCAEDSKVMIWNIPDELGEPESPDITPAATLSGHSK